MRSFSVLMINSLATLNLFTVFFRTPYINPTRIMYLYSYRPILLLPTQALLNNNLSLILFYLFVVRAFKCCQVTKRKKWKNCFVQIIFYRPTSKFLSNITFSPHGFFFLLFGTSSSVLCSGLWNVIADYIYLVI